MKVACSSQSGCWRVLFDGSRFGRAEEIARNVFFIPGCDLVAQITRIETRLSPDSARGYLSRLYVLCRCPINSIATERTRWRVILTNECTGSRSKFDSKANYPSASRARRDFHGVVDRRRCDEFDLVSRQD